MQNFRYESLTAQGEARSGVLAAHDRAEAVRMLLGRGETATRVLPIDERARVSRSTRTSAPATGGRSTERRFTLLGRKATLSQPEMANLMRELATALEAGLPLMQSLRTVRKQAPGRALPEILDFLIERVEAGDPLYAAARDYGPPFNNMIIGMLRAADASGEMSDVLHQLADLLERSVELKREITGATIYPLIVVCLLLGAVVVLVTVLVPRLIEPLAGSLDLPWPTRLVLGVADFFAAWWLYILIGLTLIVVGARMWVNVPANRLIFDRAKLKTPLIGRVLRDVAIARFTRTMGTLASSGLPILDALRITKQTLGNAALADAIDQVEDQVTAGKALADPLERSGLFPPLLIQVVSLGERSGRLESMLMHAATAFDRQVNTSIKIFTKALPPVLLIIMASLGGFILAAILLPLLQLQSMVG